MMTIEELQKFCADEEVRVSLSKPFTRGGYTWATDGRILVRVPPVEGAVARDDVPNAEALWSAQNFDVPMRRFTRELPPFSQKAEECEACDGRGRKHRDCPGCACDCVECDGEGSTVTNSDHNQHIEIGSQWFAQHYIRLIAKLPGLMVAVNPQPDKLMPFTFDGGAGLLMPMRR